ncbi:TatD family hydrolase [Levilactobacillus bambusae]|uniref:DNAase n=1 Tax=Levilactobacillus bambusae TaxID=2024736 RepID=A0A2V1MZP0_9LACO|nr:TatD family hydrolase [Levilactobacillus bambusae]PWG00474.1 DNAase [Levilactobacillus bambusae]
MLLIDAHTHIETDDMVNQLQQTNSYATLNCASPVEFKRNLSWTLGYDRIKLSAGIHPWSVESVTWSAMQPIMAQVPVIGEVGLDNVWTKNSVVQQKNVFEHQLAYAREVSKPVIIHTKGLELETLKLLRKYPNTYFIHWYSSPAYVSEFLKLGCYFSIGPSFATEASVKQLIQLVPREKVLVESDGLESLAWALDQPVDINDYQPFMIKMIQTLADRHHISIDAMGQQLVANINRFWQGQP